jgi:hypothetical protein
MSIFKTLYRNINHLKKEEVSFSEESIFSFSEAEEIEFVRDKPLLDTMGKCK